MHIKACGTGMVGGSNFVYLTSHCVIIVHTEIRKIDMIIPALTLGYWYWGLLTTGILLITRLLGFADNRDLADNLLNQP